MLLNGLFGGVRVGDPDDGYALEADDKRERIEEASPVSLEAAATRRTPGSLDSLADWLATEFLVGGWLAPDAWFAADDWLAPEAFWPAVEDWSA